jgi:hypothetical protein
MPFGVWSKHWTVPLADLEKALQVQADARRSAHEDGVAAATAFISSGAVNKMRAGLCRLLARPLLGSGGGEGRAHERRKGLRASFSHDCRSMIVDRSLADAEIGCDVLAGMASENEVQDLTLTRC